MSEYRVTIRKGVGMLAEATYTVSNLARFFESIFLIEGDHVTIEVIYVAS